MKLLTVTIPCYNSQDYMAKAIESALQGGDDVEILVVDDGSKDDTLSIAQQYESKYPHIVRAIHKMVDMVLQSIRELQTLPDFILRY